MHRWHEALLTDAILNPAAKAKMYRRHTPEGAGAKTFYGYGWALFPTRFNSTLVTHNGGNGSFFADFLRFLDEDVTIFVVTNAMQDEYGDAAFKLADAVFNTEAVDPALFGQGGPACGPQSLAFLDTLRVLEALPSTATGTTAQLTLDLLLNSGTPAALRSFIQRHVSEELTNRVGTTDLDLLTAGMVSIQQELEGFTIAKLYGESERAFHAGLTSANSGQKVLTIVFSQSAPTEVSCLEVTTF